MHYLTLWEHGTQQHKQKGKKHFERAFDGGSQSVFWLYIYIQAEQRGNHINKLALLS